MAFSTPTVCGSCHRHTSQHEDLSASHVSTWMAQFNAPVPQIYVGSLGSGGWCLICAFDAAGSAVRTIAAPGIGGWLKLNACR